MQNLEDSNFRNLGYRTVWGVPAAPQLHKGPEDSKRGTSTGVSLHSKFPIRPSRTAEISEWNTAGRFLHAFLRLAQIEIQICCIYGYPANLQNSRQKTNSLLQHAIETIRQTTFPAIICGDLNHAPDALEAMQELRDLGFVSTNELFQSLYGYPIPPTFGISTTNDVALISPSLSKMITNVWVDNQQLFPGHHPMGFTLQLPDTPLYTQTWKLPQSWLPFQPDNAKIAYFFNNPLNEYTDLHPLHAWAKQTEDAIDRAIAQQHTEDPARFPTSQLPKRCKGRCKPLKIIQQPHPRSIKTACDGQFTPQIDQATMAIKQATRQLRRIQSLKLRFAKIAKTRQCTDDVVVQLHLEWTAILHAKGFERSFQSWMEHFPELYPLPLTLPDVPFLNDVEQLLKHHVDALVAEQSQRQRQHAKFMRRQDVNKYGKQQAFQAIRPATPGLVQVIKMEKTMLATRAQNPEWGLVQLHLQEKYEIDLRAPIQICGQPAQIINYDFPLLELNPVEPIDELPLNVVLTQTIHTADPKEVADALQKHWDHYWQRDDPTSDSNANIWDDFHTFCRQIPDAPILDIAQTDLAVWKNAIKSLKSRSARGTCSWFPDEIKSLPDVCIQKLSEVVANFAPNGFPKWLMQAKTIPLAKCQEADHPGATRPITILPLLYRLWGKVITSQILQAWNISFPQAITGFLPGRSPTNFQYGLQLHLESLSKKLTDRYLSGLTLDILKAFNCLPRFPTKILVEKFGVPSTLTEAWNQSIENCTRCWAIDGQIWPQTTTSTGYPEGDAWSVVAMLAINAYWVFHALQVTPKIAAFADNWSYGTENPQHHAVLIPLLDRLTKSVRLTIDWSKTWGWATNALHKSALITAKTQHLPDEVEIAIVSNARDLGYIIHYNAKQSRATQKERHAKALTALKKLRHVDIPLEAKAQIATASAFAKALWGTSFYLSGQRFFEELRAEFAHAIFGNYHNIQSHVAAMALLKSGMDPELYVIHASIRTARHFLCHATDDEKEMFWLLVRQPLPHAATIAGPAMAFKQYITKLNWTLEETGNIRITAFTVLNLIDSNLNEILDAATDAWMEIVVEVTGGRKHMRNMPPIDREATIAAFATVPEKFKLSMGLESTGGFMLNSQKAHFADQVDGKCNYCEEMDSHRHRVLHCKATQEARVQHSSICQQLEEAEDMQLAFPLAYKSPEDQFLQDMLYRIPEPHLEMPNAPKLTWVYTDGSCYLPNSRRYRWSAFAIVCPAVPMQALLQLTQTQPEVLLRKAYHVIAVSIVPGKQTINRAELFAAVLTHEQQMNAVVVTDSAYVINMHSLVCQTRNVMILHKLPNWDLLRRLHHLYWRCDYALPHLKIKAHQNITTQTADEVIHILGNRAADEAAKQAAKHQMTIVTKDLRRLHAESRTEQQNLTAQYALRVDLVVKRTRLDNEIETTKAPERQMERLEQMHSYIVEHSRKFSFTEEDFHNARSSKFGRRTTHLLLQWLQQLEWPTSPEEVTPPIGITWVELTVNFMLCSQSSVPVQPHQEEQGFTIRTNTFRNIIMHVQFLVNKEIIPKLTPVKVKSLSQLGAKVLKQGLPLRPKLPLQDETLEILQKYFREHGQNGKACFTAMPHIPLMDPVVTTDLDETSEFTQKDRQKLYRERRQQMKDENTNLELAAGDD